MAAFLTVSMYLKSILNSFGLTCTLGTIVPLRDGSSRPILSSGAWAVVFKVLLSDREAEQELKPYALRCFLRHYESRKQVCEFLNGLNSPYLIHTEYLEDELYVYEGQNRGSYQSVELMEWVDGHTLERELELLCGSLLRGADSVDVCCRLKKLARRFDEFGVWLLRQEFAHGDITTNNIIVDTNGELRLIDYDGVYIPGITRRDYMVFSPEYQHPLRDSYSCGLWVDDYSIALISLNLHLLAEDPHLFMKMRDGSGLIINSLSLSRTAGKSNPYDEILDRAVDHWFKSANSELVRLVNMVRGDSPQLYDLGNLLRRICGLSGPSATEGVQQEPLELFCHRGRYGYRYADGTIAIDPVFYDAEEFCEGLAAVKTLSGYAFIDRSANIVIECYNYCRVDSFRCGLARVMTPQKLYGYIDRSGAEIIEARFSCATSFRNYRAKVTLDEEFEIDEMGQRV